MGADADLGYLPDDLPSPPDDGACAHLLGATIPEVWLPSTAGPAVNVAELTRGPTVLYFYPGTLRPGTPIPEEWTYTPGARGCTLQNEDFGRHHARFRSLGFTVVGVSGQGKTNPEALDDQKELVARLGLPYPLLNDSGFALVRALRLPTFRVALRSPEFEFEGLRRSFPLQGKTLVRRLTLVADRGVIRRVFYPVFPPHTSAARVLDSLRTDPL